MVSTSQKLKARPQRLKHYRLGRVISLITVEVLLDYNGENQ